MSTLRAHAPSGPATVDRSQVYMELTKPRITFMVLLTVAVGYFCATPYEGSFLGVLHVLVGTALSCSGSGALNQYLERDVDLFMDRTRFRPLPAQQISASGAALLGAALSIGGVAYLALFVNGISAALNALTVLSYLFLYTPMKRVTPLSTLAGAVPGALPPVIGWTAASGEIGAGAVVLFAILFLWQVPHFLAIGCMYREDYAKAGFPMLVVVDREGDTTARQMVLYALTLLPTSLLLSTAGIGGHLYYWCAVALGLAYAVTAWRAAVERSRVSARRLLLCSVFYLPLLFGVLFIERLLLSLRAAS
jgi:protoheme IX farnesyltransferase